MPVNTISDHALLVILAVVIFCGEVSARPRAWAAAAAIVVLGAAAQAVLSPPRIEKGQPRDYLRAGHELLTLHFPGEYLGRSVQQIAHWLSGLAESYATIPLNALGVAILLYVVVRGSAFDPVATADWCLGTGATCRGAVLHRRRSRVIIS